MLKTDIGQAFAPGHITGFFEIGDESANPMQIGSRGAGVCIDKGVKTLVRLKPSTHLRRIKILINHKEDKKALVSQELVNILLANRNNLNLLIDHEVEIPIGCGLGASGAGALSLALALNQLLGLGSTLAMGQAAHLAEINCKTGLGTVLAQMAGGFELRKEPGAPGIGVVKKLKFSEDRRVVCLILKKISTPKMLSDKQLKKKINENGARTFSLFLKQPTIDKFIDASRDFAESVGLISPLIRKILRVTDQNGFVCSQAMFGETIFSIVPKSAAPVLLEILRRIAPTPHLIINAKIDCKGARVLGRRRE